MQNKRSVGSKYEQAAVEYLEGKGYGILERNYRCHREEVDIIAEKDGVIIFVEVKYRINNLKGHPGEAVDKNKQRAISRVAAHYLTTRLHSTEVPCRFDVICILESKIEHYENAFCYAL